MPSPIGIAESVDAFIVVSPQEPVVVAVSVISGREITTD